VLISTLAEWLKVHWLERFASLIEQNEVDLQTLRLLTDDDLKELGLPFGPRKRILSLLAEERQREKSSPPSAAAGTPAGERRQLTVLFCDMVGFTKLAHRLDPETLQVVVRAYEDACATCVNRYDGYVFTTLGDGSSPSSAIRWPMKARRSGPFAPDWTSSRPWPLFRSATPAGCMSASGSPPAWSWSPPASATRSGRR